MGCLNVRGWPVTWEVTLAFEVHSGVMLSLALTVALNSYQLFVAILDRLWYRLWYTVEA